MKFNQLAKPGCNHALRPELVNRMAFLDFLDPLLIPNAGWDGGLGSEFHTE